MFCSVLIRRLKEGVSFEDFGRAWEPEEGLLGLRCGCITPGAPATSGSKVAPPARAQVTPPWGSVLVLRDQLDQGLHGLFCIVPLGPDHYLLAMLCP